MSKKQVEAAIKVLPDIISKIGDYLKDSGNSILKSIGSNNGTIGLVVKVFGQPLIDKYFEHAEKEKLSNYGLETYLIASLKQAGISLDSALSYLQEQYSVDAIEIGVRDAVLNLKEKIKVTEFTLFFQPKFHPVIQEVEIFITEFLNSLEISKTDIEQFRKSYYEEIELTIKNEFGDDLYQKHLEQIKSLLFTEAECKLLNDNINISRIGFKENESLLYEEAYGELLPISTLFTLEEDPALNSEKNIDKKEQNLLRIEDLIDKYFSSEKESYLDNILFAIADFGKGKSTFLKHYAAKISRQYLKDSSSYFPVYFNLRNFIRYKSS